MNGYGFYILPGNVGDSFTFRSSEYSSSSYRPQLIVSYTPPVSVLPDLIVTDLYPGVEPVNNTYYVGDDIEWMVTVRNNSAGAAGDYSDVAYYLGDSNTDFSNKIDECAISGLSPGESRTCNEYYLFTANDVGQKYIICKADYENDVEESNEDNNTRVYGPFNVVNPTGSLQVTLTPQGAIDDGAQWRLTSGPDTGWKGSGQSISGITMGNYTLQFKEIDGWQRPDDRSILISEGSNSESGEYLIRATISSITPGSGPKGSYIKIEGTDFGSTAGSVDFNGMASSQIVSWSDTEIYCRVPEIDISGDNFNLNEGLVSYWSFEDATITDQSGNNNDGTIYGATATSGVYGQALAFDGVDDYGLVPNSNSLNITDGLTISYWIKLESCAPFYFPYHIIEKHNSWGTRQREWDLEFAIKTEQGDYDSVSVNNLTPDNFYNITLTYDNNAMKIYVNGDLSASKIHQYQGKIAISSSDLIVGQYDLGGDYFFDGILDEVKIWNRALSATEVDSLVSNSSSQIIFTDDFRGDLTWTTSDDSIYIKDGEYLYISADGVNNDDYVEKEFSIDLTSDKPIVIEQRIKLESGGLNYRLPVEYIYFENDDMVSITYLPHDPPDYYGWHFIDWTGLDEPEIPGTGWWTTATADYWVVTKIIITPSGGQLYMKPDDPEKGWYSADFTFVTSASWSHSQITKIRFRNPWDSVNYIDYIKITSLLTQNLLTDNFENYSVNTWPSEWDPDANANASGNGIVTDPVNPSNQVLKLYGSVGGCWGALAYTPCAFPDDFWLECDIYNGSEALSGCHPDRGYIGLRNGTSWTNPSRMFIMFKGNGDIVGTDNTVLGSYNTEQWYHVKIHYSRVGINLSLSYWLDEVYLGQTNVTIDDLAREESLDHIDLTIQEGSAYFDNVEVYVPTNSDEMTWIYIDDPGVDGHEGFTGYMSKYETTNAQYCEFLNAALASGDITVSGDIVYGAAGSNSGEDFVAQVYYDLAGAGANHNGATNGGAARINYTGSSFTVDSGFENHPVTYVSWYGSTAFCNYYGWRLPTEWEWQAVADYDGSFNYGCGVNISNSIANYYDSIHPDGTTVVGSFGDYGYGMCDMAGNVFEWTSSIDWDNYRLILGGDWDWYVEYCLVSYRNNVPPAKSNCGMGFRVCRDDNVSGAAGIQVVRSSGVASESQPFVVTQPETIIVDLLNTTGIENGSITYPFSTIQRGIDAASDGAEVVVSSGVYCENINFCGKAITVNGSGGSSITTINGSQSGSVVSFINGETSLSVLEGFTITAGSGTSADNGPSGGGIFCQNSSPTIKRCIIVDNNVGTGSGGGVACYDGSPKVTGCILSGNSAQNGGGVYCHSDASVSVENCTLVDNSNGVYCYSGGNATVINSILWNNGDDLYGCLATYSCIEDNDAGDGIIHTDPLFVDPSNNNCHLLPDSPCIDAGDPASDWSNEPGPNGARINMGAYGNTSEATRSRGGLEFAGFEIVSKTRTDRTTYLYELSLSLANITDNDLSNVHVMVIDADDQVIGVTDGDIVFPVIPARSVVKSSTVSDTFTIEIDRSELITEGRLTWQVDFEQVQVTSTLLMSAEVSDTKGPGIAGDLSGDYCVDLEDFAKLAAHWLENEPIVNLAEPDDIIDIMDLEALLGNWLR